MIHPHSSKMKKLIFRNRNPSEVKGHREVMLARYLLWLYGSLTLASNISLGLGSVADVFPKDKGQKKFSILPSEVSLEQVHKSSSLT